MNEFRNTAFLTTLQRDGPVLLDGGLATQLESQGCDIKDELWSAGLLCTNSDAIVTAHRAFLDAGAECISTASYQASREGFAKKGIGEHEADNLMLFSVELAKKARAEARSEALIAVSLGPYGAMLNDGSEYRGDYGVSTATLHDFHAQRIGVLDRSDADVLALETVPSFDEAKVIAELLNDCSMPAWVSFSCKDEAHICDGTLLADAASLFSAHSNVKAIGINCTPPQFVPALVDVIRRSVPDAHILAYPNSGETYDSSDGSWTGTVTPGDCAIAAKSWVAAGARLVGGCCRMGPVHIAAMADALGKESR